MAARSPEVANMNTLRHDDRCFAIVRGSLLHAPEHELQSQVSAHVPDFLMYIRAGCAGRPFETRAGAPAAPSSALSPPSLVAAPLPGDNAARGNAAAMAGAAEAEELGKMNRASMPAVAALAGDAMRGASGETSSSPSLSMLKMVVYGYIYGYCRPSEKRVYGYMDRGFMDRVYG